ncbi:toxin co-regulated pilus biosynthesis Q family protein [Pandoraea commovens]|uniref:Toxin co-regulated pilus biosynthesis Q family protein n=1 Tax=Pandoraea commovens TaxID=2508289 RepID=A0ABY5QFY8_9BURK|nr:toxin co-regulated pilus biosynthesis Q family protein [Pandoraea commovens]UVA79726.1 toxin co-regulated pilus biosynthesis Q family protein [Pandoraea commovens]
MTLPGMRVAVLASMLGAAVPSALAAEAASGTGGTWVLASHKPLMQSLGGGADAVPVPESTGAQQLVQEGPQPIDDSQRDVQTVGVAAPLAISPPVPVAMELALQPSDGRVSQAVRRYAERNGWQLAWEIERDFPIEYPATFRGDFLGIVEQIVRSLQNTDAPIRVKVYEANRVLRVVHATQ